MGKFDKVKTGKTIENVATKSATSANTIQVKMISVENLVPHPRNNEDVSHTEDLEVSIQQNGFTDPIDVTAYGMEEGKYMIVSGHRRVEAGKKCNVGTFPCIVRTFKSELDVYNFLLMANSTRDSAKDPLLIARRYKMHETYLKESGFKGGDREEIAKRLGLSVQQADRYKQFGKVIADVWAMVENGTCGMSSVIPMANFNEEQQLEIKDILDKALKNGEDLTRERCRKIFDAFIAGMRTYEEILESEKPIPVPLPSGNDFDMNPPVENNPLDRNDEVNYDTSHREGLTEESYAEERLTQDDYDAIELTEQLEEKEKEKEEKHELTEEEKKLANGVKLRGVLQKLDDILEHEFYDFEDKKVAVTTVTSMFSLIGTIVDEAQKIADKYDVPQYKESLTSAIKNLQAYLN